MCFKNVSNIVVEFLWDFPFYFLLFAFFAARLVCVNTFLLTPGEYLLKQSLLPADLFKRICLAIYPHRVAFTFCFYFLYRICFAWLSMTIWQPIQ